MSKRVCFIGHRNLSPYQNVNEKLKTAIKREIDLGCRNFIMGTHGEFDRLALSLCREFRRLNKDIEIEVVITSLNMIKKKIIKDEIFGNEIITPFSDVKTIMYEIEDEHFKRRITSSNLQMINDCDTLICYVNENSYRSGAKTAMKYAKKKGIKIVNLYKEERPTLCD